MKNESGSQNEDSVMSPGAFISGLQPSQSFREHFEKHKDEGLSKAHSEKLCRASIFDGTKSSEKSEKKRLAGLKSRVKKQIQLSSLQESVNELSTKIQQCERQISKCKDELVQAIKLSTHSSNEHAFTFSELERLITTDDVDLDEINLLLDIIQSRIGANGKERQSKLEYNFKQIINSLFPALHRYLMYSAVNNKDLFFEPINQIQSSQQPMEKWTKHLYEDLHIAPQMIYKFAKQKPNFIKKREETIELISKLKTVKNQLKNQEQTIQKAMSQFRVEMTPVQSSRIILFGEKNKLRRQFLFLDQIFVMEKPPSKQQKLQ